MLARGKSPKFTISPIPAFGGHPLQIAWLSITEEARANLPNVLEKILWSFLPGAPRREGPPLWTPGHPPVTSLNTFEKDCRMQ
jgi:hypothetical protein